MRDYGKRFLVVMIIALCIGLLFIGGKTGHAAGNDLKKLPDVFLWPAKGKITDHFGTRHQSHFGIDIASEFNERIIAAAGGIVTKSYFSSTYGNVVFINHNSEYETVYAHLNKRLVHEGDSVAQGDTIGTMGNTGRSRGVHLHFEVHQKQWTVDKQNAINPLLVLTDRKKELVALNREPRDETQNSDVKQQFVDPDTPTAYTKGDFTYFTDKTKEFTVKVKDVYYVVKKGDTLWSISRKYGVSVNKIRKWNSIADDFIIPNQKVKLIFGQGHQQESISASSDQGRPAASQS
jgi:murein DD-endopeptidase MepM/ murein hydrolase activator NlpD